jgi:hypothetical protein
VQAEWLVYVIGFRLRAKAKEPISTGQPNGLSLR